MSLTHLQMSRLQISLQAAISVILDLVVWFLFLDLYLFVVNRGKLFIDALYFVITMTGLKVICHCWNWQLWCTVPEQKQFPFLLAFHLLWFEISTPPMIAPREDALYGISIGGHRRNLLVAISDALDATRLSITTTIAFRPKRYWKDQAFDYQVLPKEWVLHINKHAAIACDSAVNHPPKA
jgi:hypothetical protein